MIRVLSKDLPTELGQPVNSGSVFHYVITGSSEDVANLPVEDVMTGSVFIEADTHTTLMFDEESHTWG